MSQNGDNSSSQTSNQHVDLDLDKFSSPPSNKKLLCIAFVSFQSFAMVQLGAAIYAGSEAMLGDSIAMMVDALTYLFNLIAERQKEVYASKLQQQNKSSCAITPFTRSRMVLKYRKYTYQLELIPPVLSIATLLIVIGLVMKEAVHTLILDFQRDASLQSDPNVNLMMGFSVFNLILDLVNVGCFASASHALGYKTDPAATDDPNDGDETDKATNKTHEVDERVDASAKNDSENDCDYDPGETKSDGFSVEAPYDAENRSLQLHDYDDRFRGDKVGDSTNLNMCSAYTVSTASCFLDEKYVSSKDRLINLCILTNQ